MTAVAREHTKPCVRLDPHDPHFWAMAAIDGDTYWCPGVNVPVAAESKLQAKQPLVSWDRPEHYGGEDNPFEPIKIIEHYDLNFNLGCVIKYVLRASFKGTALADLKKAYTYIGFEIRRRERAGETE
jgi:hypothetical protein